MWFWSNMRAFWKLSIADSKSPNSLKSQKNNSEQDVLYFLPFNTSITWQTVKPDVPVGLPEAFIGVYEVWLQLQGLFKSLYGFLKEERQVRSQDRIDFQKL